MRDTLSKQADTGGGGVFPPILFYLYFKAIYRAFDRIRKKKAPHLKPIPESASELFIIGQRWEFVKKNKKVRKKKKEENTLATKIATKKTTRKVKVLAEDISKFNF